MRNEIKKVGSMREYTEQDKEKKIKSEKIDEKFEKEFQPEKKPKNNDEMGNDFIPIVDNPNNIYKFDNDFEPFDNSELNPKPSTQKTQQKIQKIKEVKHNIILRNSGDLAEMITIALGDGSIPKDESHFRIILNRTEEKQYRKYVLELMQKLFKKTPGIYKPKDANAVKMTISRKEIVRALISKGLKPGDKKENQVDVPQWIKKKKEFQTRGLRGLVDTDGSIHIHKHNKTLHISFNNASFPLVNDFKKMCKTLNIETVKISPVKGKNTYTTGMESKKEVAKFIYKVRPKKWEYRAMTFGMVLKSISDPDKRIKIEKELQNSYPDRRIHHTKDYKDKLKNLCVKYSYDVSNESIIKEIEKMFTYNDKYPRYTKEEKIKLNFYANNIIKELKNKFK